MHEHVRQRVTNTNLEDLCFFLEYFENDKAELYFFPKFLSYFFLIYIHIFYFLYYINLNLYQLLESACIS